MAGPGSNPNPALVLPKLIGALLVAGVLGAGVLLPFVGGLGLVAKHYADKFENTTCNLQETPPPEKTQVYAKDGKELTVGIHANEAARVHSNGVTVLQAAIWNEFGTDTIPARPFLTAWFDENLDLLFFWVKGEFSLVAQGKQSKDQALRRVGEKCVAAIKQRMVSRIPPPNRPSTIAKKGSDIPLIDTGLLWSSIGAYVDGRQATLTAFSGGGK